MKRIFPILFVFLSGCAGNQITLTATPVENRYQFSVSFKLKEKESKHEPIIESFKSSERNQFFEE